MWENLKETLFMVKASIFSIKSSLSADGGKMDRFLREITAKVLVFKEIKSY